VRIPATSIDGNPGDGFSSGGDLVKALTAPSYSGFNIIGYAGESDAGAGAGANGATTNNWLRYEGVVPTHENVANGTYPIWCYEQAYMRFNQNVGNKGAVFNALLAQINNSGYQATNTAIFRPAAVALSEMQVKRGSDGGSFTTTPLAGW
jgi:hypothetical protein